MPNTLSLVGVVPGFGHFDPSEAILDRLSGLQGNLNSRNWRDAPVRDLSLSNFPR